MRSRRDPGRVTGPGRLVVCSMAVLLALTSTAQAAGRAMGITVSVVTSTGPGQVVTGELIGVRSEAILLDAGADKTLTIAVSEILTIRVHKRSKAILGGVIGMLAGGTISYLASYSEYKGKYLGELGIAGAVTAGTTGGLLLGGLAGALAGADKTYRLSGLPESARRSIMEKLRKKSRVPSYR